MCKKVNIFLPVLVVFYVAMSLAVSFYVYKGGEMTLWFSCILSELMLLIPAVGYILITKIDVAKSLPWRLLKPTDALLAVVMGYALVPLTLLISNISLFFSTNEIAEVEVGLTSYPFLVQIILLAVLPPLVEEFLFRGLFYHSYRKNGVLGGALVSGLVFGMIHLNVNQFCYAVVLGFIFALLVEGTGSIWTSIIAHFAINSTSIIMFKLESMFASDVIASEQNVTIMDYPLSVAIISLLWLALIAAVCGYLAFLIFRRISKKSGRWEYFVGNVKKGFRAQNGEHFVTIPAFVTFVICFAYMVVYK